MHTALHVHLRVSPERLEGAHVGYSLVVFACLLAFRFIFSYVHLLLRHTICSCSAARLPGKALENVALHAPSRSSACQRRCLAAPDSPDNAHPVYQNAKEILFKLFKQSSRRDAQFLRGARKAVRRDRAVLGCRRLLLA